MIAQQGKAPRPRQPALAAAICLLGRNCESHERFLAETLTFTTKNLGHQELARSSADGARRAGAQRPRHAPGTR